MVASESDLKFKKGVIYLIRNLITGWIYIGKTERTFWQRYHGGKWWVKSDNKQLKEEGIKYGPENFSIELLETGISTEELIPKEISYIEKYNCVHPNGYNRCKNSSRGMSGVCEETRNAISMAQKKSWAKRPDHLRFGRVMTEESKDILRQKRLGSKASAETKKKMSLARAGKGHSLYGKSIKGFQHTEESKAKISKKRKEVGNKQNCNAIIQMDADNGSFIKEFTSAEEASKEIGCSTCNIYGAINGKQNQVTAAGFKWKYKIPRKKNRTILQIDNLTGKVIGEFKTAKQAAKLIGIKGSANIFSVCNGHRFTCGTYKWAYKDSYETT